MKFCELHNLMSLIANSVSSHVFQDVQQRSVFVVDEVGKMEMFSDDFTRSIRKLLDAPDVTLLVTIPVRKQNPIPLAEEIRGRKDVRLFEVCPSLTTDLTLSGQLVLKTR